MGKQLTVKLILPPYGTSYQDLDISNVCCSIHAETYKSTLPREGGGTYCIIVVFPTNELQLVCEGLRE